MTGLSLEKRATEHNNDEGGVLEYSPDEINSEIFRTEGLSRDMD
jgi:hypothetical protein